MGMNPTKGVLAYLSTRQYNGEETAQYSGFFDYKGKKFVISVRATPDGQVKTGESSKQEGRPTLIFNVTAIEHSKAEGFGGRRSGFNSNRSRGGWS